MFKKSSGRNFDMSSTIWIISEIFHPEESATSHILTAIAKGLADKARVNVITGLPDYSGGKVNVKKKETLGKIQIERCVVPSLNKNKLPLRILRALSLSIAISIKSLVHVRKGDLVIVVTNPATILFFMAIVAKVKKGRLFIVSHDIFPQNLVAAKIISNDSAFLKIVSFFAKIAYESAEKIFVIGRDMGELLRTNLAVSQKIEVITNWADCGEVFPAKFEDIQLVKKYHLGEKFVVGFAGNLGRVQGIEFLIDTIASLEGCDIHFLIVGDGAKKHLFDEAKARGSLSNVTLLGNMPRAEQTEFLNACHIGLVSLSPGMFGLGVPSKSYNIMAAGKPIIAVVDKNSEIGLMVEEERIGWVVPPGEPELLAEVILEAKQKFKELDCMGKRARYAAEKKYSYPVVIKKYRKYLGI